MEQVCSKPRKTIAYMIHPAIRDHLGLYSLDSFQKCKPIWQQAHCLQSTETCSPWRTETHGPGEHGNPLVTCPLHNSETLTLVNVYFSYGFRSRALTLSVASQSRLCLPLFECELPNRSSNCSIYFKMRAFCCLLRLQTG